VGSVPMDNRRLTANTLTNCLTVLRIGNPTTRTAPLD
jgi:hypothetical protein